MSRSYQRLGLPPSTSPCTALRTAVRALLTDTLAVRSFRAARKRYYREFLQAHAEAQSKSRHLGF